MGSRVRCRRGMSLPEIMLAMVVLATAMIPVFALMTQDVKDTDVLVANSFAVDRARLVLNTLLDEVPFSGLLPGNPAVLAGAKAPTWAAAIFPGAAAVSGGMACQGIASDVRGICYQIYLRADPIEDTTDGYTNGEFFFTFYENPTYEEQTGYATMTAEAITTEVNLGQPSIYRSNAPVNPLKIKSPYQYFDIPGQTRSWGPDQEIRSASGPVRVDTRMVTRPNADGRYYLMQRLILQIRWNLAASEYRRPTSDVGRPQRLHVVTYKARLE